VGLIRLLLAMTVVLSHAGFQWFVGSRNAVQMFYIISGFLIAFILNTNRKYDRKIDFYVSRALRIYPVYFCVAVIAIFYPLYGSETGQIYTQAPIGTAIALFFSNLVIFGQDLVMFMSVKSGVWGIFAAPGSDFPLYRGLLVPQAWSLGIELSFYLIAPYIVRSKVKTILVFMASCAIRYIYFDKHPEAVDPWTYRFFPFEIALFMLGAMSFHWMLPLWRKIVVKFSALQVIGVAALSILILCYDFVEFDSTNKSIILFLVMSALLPLAFFYQQRSKIDQALAELSYPVYVCHLLVFSLLANYTPSLSGGRLVIAKIALTLMFAFLLKISVADFFDRFRHRLSRQLLSKD